MTSFLLIDFGTTSTKSIILNINTGNFSNPLSHTALKNCAKKPGHHEFDMHEVKKRFEDICHHNYAKSPFSGIIICSEMHGFAVLDSNDNPITNYISWKDERALEKDDEINSAFTDVCNFWKDDFKTITGMKPRPGFMPMSLLHMARTKKFPNNIRIVDLPGWLSRSTGFATGHTHRSMLAGLGVYDVKNDKIAEDLVSWLAENIRTDINLDIPAEVTTVSGYWNKVPIYVGLGDHQCSLLGAGLVDSQTLSINIGTGAQISALDPVVFPEEAELRPFLSDLHLRTITHIPGGRALSTYVNFIQQLVGTNLDIWEDLSCLNAEDISDGSLLFHLGIFPGARGYIDGGSIRHINEETFDKENYLRSLLRSFAEQYIEITKLFDPETSYGRLIVSGGIARRLPSLLEFMQERTNYHIIGATDLDESLIGLRAVALLVTGQTNNIKSVQQNFGRTVTITEN
ncbi:MAG: FGGY family carbohydrate kinase [Candidatus Latescibacterota bacterium]|nr:FGGY family carbohydrate kinase [Candidatus Latescibacterota bacterium]